MADQPPTWLARRAARLYGPRLGSFRTSAWSRSIPWKWFPWLFAAGFVFGAIAEFTGSPTSSRSPGLFADVPLYVLASTLTGLVLCSVTLPWSFRRVLVFDHGLVYRYAQAHTAAVVQWHDIDASSVLAVSSPDFASAESRLKTLHPAGIESLGAGGRHAVVFRGAAVPLAQGSAPSSFPSTDALGPRFFAFSTQQDPAPLVLAMQQAMLDAGVPGAAHLASRALPPAVVVGPVTLD